MAAANRRDRAVIALGHELRGDDALGPALLDRLTRDPPADTALLASNGEATRLLNTLTQFRAVVLVDAIVTGAPAGTVHRWNPDDALPALQTLRSSTHMLSIADTLALGEALGRELPALAIVGVEALQFTLGAALSTAVAEALERAEATVREALRT